MINEIFDKYNEYIMIYLYDGISKLKDINFSQEIENNKNKKYFLEKLDVEKNYFCSLKKEDFENNSEETFKLNCPIDNNNFYSECFICHKINQCKMIDLTEYKFNNMTIQTLLNVLKFKEKFINLEIKINKVIPNYYITNEDLDKIISKKK